AASVATPADRPPEPASPLPRPDIFVGAQGTVGSHAWGAGLWGARFIFAKPVIPFALSISGFLTFTRISGADGLSAGSSLGLFLPLVRRLAIGAAPAGIRVACAAGFDRCAVDVVAVLGDLLVPLGDALWFSVQGPRWSWTERTLGDTWIGFALGWSHERRRFP